MSFTYIIVDIDSRTSGSHCFSTKIGKSTNPEKRLAQLQTGNPGRLAIVACIPGEEWERLIHRMFAAYRMTGEWFRLDLGRLYLLATLADEHDPIDSGARHELLEELGEPVMQSDDAACLLESSAFLSGWEVGEAYERSKAVAA